MLITDQVATARCTDPIQKLFPTLSKTLIYVDTSQRDEPFSRETFCTGIVITDEPAAGYIKVHLRVRIGVQNLEH